MIILQVKCLNRCYKLIKLERRNLDRGFETVFGGIFRSRVVDARISKS